MQVLEVIKSEKMMSSANMIGKQLRRSLLNLRDRFPCVGDVRGCGLVQSLEIVEDKEGKVASAELASEIMFRMKTRQVLVAITGKQSNIILLTPPLCFTMENCRLLVAALEEVLISVNLDQRQHSLGSLELDDLEKPLTKRIRLEDLEDEEEVAQDFLNEMD